LYSIGEIKMSWTDFFLIPFNVSLKIAKNSLLPKHNIDDEEKKEYSEAKRLRNDILAHIDYALMGYSLKQLQTMIFGDPLNFDLSNNEEIICFKNVLDEFKKEDQIAIDVVDKMIIDRILDYLDEFLEKNYNKFP
jgi:hypothetical protein